MIILKNPFARIAIISIAVLGFVSCDNDFNTVGAGVIGEPNFENKKYKATPAITNQILDRIQTSNLPVYLLGIYDDPTYGKSTYDFVSQVSLDTLNPKYGNDPVLENVVLNIPFFSTETAREVIEGTSEIKRTYSLDSVYGNTPMDISIYKSNFFLDDFDTSNSNPEKRKIYFSDLFQNASITAELQKDTLAILKNFVASKDEIIFDSNTGKRLSSNDTIAKQKTRIRPSLRVELNTDIFQELFIDKEGGPEFSNINNFRNFFRGIYLKVAASEGNTGTENLGSLFYFDRSAMDITLFYSFLSDKMGENPDGMTRSFKQRKLNFDNNSVNGIQNDFTNPITTPESGNTIYVKGGVGSYAVLDLFNNYIALDGNGQAIIDEDGNPEYVTDPDSNTNKIKEIDYIKKQNWLVKDAIIKLYVDKSKLKVDGSSEPERIYIFNTETGSRLIDFCEDPSRNAESPVNSIISHLTRLQKGTDSNGDFYQIRITRHLINILNENTENVKLGITVSQNVNIEASFNNNNCSNIVPAEANKIDDDIFVPFSAVIAHEGTVLFGNTEEVPLNKRLQLIIDYTTSKTN